MIAHLNGIVHSPLPNQLIIDVNGVGYQVAIPVSTYDKLLPQPGDKVSIHTYLHIRENAQTLYGFASLEEKDVFLLLINRVTGIGPSIAMSVLSCMPVHEFKTSVANEDVTNLSKIKGLGKKTAERIVLELRDKVGVTDAWKDASNGIINTASADAELALISLGYKQVEARKAIKLSISANAEATTEDLIKSSLRMLNS
ncbi:Holliday junction branch migration protein RuvA [Akkermansiaceae bacterium]|nr:Holliday junction branch migration protein RuvA [Akkermansiaceae bacterium]